MFLSRRAFRNAQVADDRATEAPGASALPLQRSNAETRHLVGGDKPRRGPPGQEAAAAELSSLNAKPEAGTHLMLAELLLHLLLRLIQLLLGWRRHMHPAQPELGVPLVAAPPRRVAQGVPTLEPVVPDGAPSREAVQLRDGVRAQLPEVLSLRLGRGRWDLQDGPRCELPLDLSSMVGSAGVEEA